MANPASLPSDEKYCKDCGAVIKRRAEICPHCGVRQLAPPPASGSNRVTAALLAIFLGTFGVHKFYLGQTVMGLVYLIFCWSGIPTLLGWIEGILYLIRSDADFAAIYDKR